jgi:hypothetical protein
MLLLIIQTKGLSLRITQTRGMCIWETIHVAAMEHQSSALIMIKLEVCHSEYDKPEVCRSEYRKLEVCRF